ncbi:hypothetical protein CRG98_042915 [Punica granatum]|uniref:Uncharacterized protein n=1 Tax=Punica granatum TaxID=22663 RepID=A0A2I0HYB0_PUNGR|nr:hypothetical protein CRG98_042915 [Punica granatum]
MERDPEQRRSPFHGHVEDRTPTNGGFDFYDDDHPDYAGSASSMSNQLLPVSWSSPPLSASTSSLPAYIEHPVADLKRLNGLVTDIQMFALKSLHVPLPGRHPPSTCLSTGSNDIGESSSERTPPHHASNLLDSFQSPWLKSSQQKVSPAMSSLQGYYGLESKGGSHCLEDGLFIRMTPTVNPPLGRHRKSKSLVIDFLDEKGLGDLIGADSSLSSVRKSSSTSNLQDQETSSLSSIWPTPRWSMKPDLQSLSTAAITRPIFDGLPKPLTTRRNKAALD